MTKASPARVASRRQPSTDGAPIPLRHVPTEAEDASEQQATAPGEQLPTQEQMREYSIGSAMQKAMTDELGRLNVALLEKTIRYQILEQEAAQKDALIAEMQAQIG